MTNGKEEKKYISLVLEGEALMYFEKAFNFSGFKSNNEYLRNLIRDDYSRNLPFIEKLK